jgi:hypothetical protein
MNKVSFRIVYKTKTLNQLNDILSKFDLGIEEIIYPTRQIWTMKTKSIVDKDYIKKMIRAIKKTIKHFGGTVICIDKI